MFFFKAQLMPLMYAQRVVNKYLTRCGKEIKEAKDIEINEQQTKIEHQHHTNTQIYIYIRDIILVIYKMIMNFFIYYEHSLGSFFEIEIRR